MIGLLALGGGGDQSAGMSLAWRWCRVKAMLRDRRGNCRMGRALAKPIIAADGYRIAREDGRKRPNELHSSYEKPAHELPDRFQVDPRGGERDRMADAPRP